jgi:hypothetical protein
MTGSTAEVIWLLAWFLVIAAACIRSVRHVRASQAAVSADEIARRQSSSRAQGWRALPFAWAGILLAGVTTAASPLREFVESPNALDGVLFIVAALLCLDALPGLWRYRIEQRL